MESLGCTEEGGNFHQEKKFANFHHLLSLAKMLSTNFLLCVNDYIEDTALMKFIPPNTKIAGFGEFFYTVCNVYYRGQVFLFASVTNLILLQSTSELHTILIS